MFEFLSANRAAISSVVIVVLALAFAGSIVFGLRDSARRRSDEVFGDPLRTTNGWYWAVAGVSSLLLVWYYFSWGAARAYFPMAANEICQVARVDEALSPINASLPAGSRFYKSTTLLTRMRCLPPLGRKFRHTYLQVSMHPPMAPNGPT